jgi:MoaA/NifB/PqqE/SkfB family radical SAM enzyme/esterase/lipase
LTTKYPGIILVHGYSGSPHDFDFLSAILVESYGKAAVETVSLPGHNNGDLPPFDAEAFIRTITGHVDYYRQHGRPIILVGHSTGGSLLLTYLSESGFTPQLLVLVGTPKKIETTWLERWGGHREEKETIPFTSVAKMISFVNTAGKRRFESPFPVHVIQGQKDTLVLFEEAHLWEKGAFAGPVSFTMIANGDHDIFQGAAREEAAQSLIRAIDVVCSSSGSKHERLRKRLLVSEPELKRFLDYSPQSLPFIAASPCGQVFMGDKPALSSFAVSPPVIANIEVTTRCMLRCPHCARSFLARKEEDMTEEIFDAVLNKLPHAYRVTFVGLGEPLMHPKIVDFVAKASSRGRRVGLVTNAMCLDDKLSRDLIEAGIASIAFSLDTTESSVASEVRKGSDLPAILDNIRGFTEKVDKRDAISMAFFTAVSVKTAPHLKGLFDCAKDLRVHVVMLTDLNFRRNMDDTLRQNRSGSLEKMVRDAVTYAFSQGLPVLSVHGLEEFGIRQRYREFLLMPPTALYDRSSLLKWCFSPWQTIPIDVSGNVTICDCQPESPAGNLLTDPFDSIWNGEIMRTYRQNMLSEAPPDPCRMCPRF